MKINVKTLAVCILIPLAVGLLSAFFTRGNMMLFDQIVKPPLVPPAWVFPVVWSILYVLMGIASYIVYQSDAPQNEIKKALAVYAAQLVVNFFWSIIFFNLQAFLFAFYWLVLLWILVVATTILFWQIKRAAGILLLPYLVWVTFAGYLTYAIFLLN
ncbi:MAG: tryptophan-rich sensory protein [Clostridia bacterium]|nr:tryptophan-rich sensory protein [Clostridia bacterium]